jgi:phosphatidylcholine synthase
VKLSRTLAWLIHAYTAAGAALAFFALAAAIGGDVRQAFLWLWLAMLIDCTDGALARAARVKQVVPEFDGARLDDIVDYLAYVFVPVAIAYFGGRLPDGGIGTAAACLPLLASGYGFARSDAKTPDHMFTGFPSYWNVVVLYFYLLGTGPAFNAVVFALLAGLVFVPIHYAYPSRNPAGAAVTFTAGPAWGLLVLYLMLQLPDSSIGLAWLSLLFPAWYIGLSLYLNARRPAVTSAPERAAGERQTT